MYDDELLLLSSLVPNSVLIPSKVAGGLFMGATGTPGYGIPRTLIATLLLALGLGIIVLLATSVGASSSGQ